MTPHLYTLGEAAGIVQGLTANFDGVGGGGAPSYGTERQQAAHDRHEKALAVLDSDDRPMVLNVVCYEEFLGGELMKNRITVRTKIGRLRLALDRLAKFYGIG